MAQLLQHNQQNYVPCIKLKVDQKKLVATIPFHGDQLFEEREEMLFGLFKMGRLLMKDWGALTQKLLTGMPSIHCTR